LSLRAEKNWVQNKGANRRDVINCLIMIVSCASAQTYG
jgi:hypothetical protein